MLNYSGTGFDYFLQDNFENNFESDFSFLQKNSYDYVD